MSRRWLFSLLAIAVAAIVPLLFPHAEYALDLLFLVFLYGAMASSWNILGGFAGQVSFGHAAFLGIGAYTAAILVGRGWPIWATALPAGVLAALYSIAIGWPAFRLRGPYFSIATIGIGEATRLVALNWDGLTGGASGLTLAYAPSAAAQYEVALALCAVTLGVSAWIASSRFGYALAAVRADTDAAESLGVDTTVAKTQALAISAFILGVAGSVYSMHYLFISPDSVFGFSTSISMVVMPLVGGIGTVLGPLLGAAIFTVLREQLEANFQNLDLLVFGVLLCAIVLFEPRGVLGLFNRLVRRRG